MIIDGKVVASDILAATRTQVATLGRTPVVRAITVAPTPATSSYLEIKSARAEEGGMRLEVVRLADDATTDDVIAVVKVAGADAVIVQLPIPASIDTTIVCNAIPESQDADVLSSIARDAFESGRENSLIPPVADAIREILLRGGVDPAGKKAMVIGRGWLVGTPVATWLKRAGADVTILTRQTSDIGAALGDADIIVSGAGVSELIKPHMLKSGVALIDAGTSESNGAIVGDADPACAEISSIFTPVPGGVGPIAVACLFRNAAKLLTA